MLSLSGVKRLFYDTFKTEMLCFISCAVQPWWAGNKRERGAGREEAC